MHRSRGAINLLWQQRLAYALNSGGVASPLKRMGPALQMHSASSPPPPMASTNESYLSGSNSAYVDEMYDSWARDPTSVQASWDAYFRGINYTPPPALGMYLPTDITNGFIAIPMSGIRLRDSLEILPQI